MRLAFVAALQHLPPRQRAVLILREVLKWKASEVAELLDTTVHVGQQRAPTGARDARRPQRRARATAAEPIDAAQQELLARYVDAFERFDVDAMVSLLHEDATMMMPPYPLWMRGAAEYGKLLRGSGSGCRGLAARAGRRQRRAGVRAVDGEPGRRVRRVVDPPLEISDGRITGINFFVDPNLFALFGLPVHLDASSSASPTRVSRSTSSGRALRSSIDTPSRRASQLQPRQRVERGLVGVGERARVEGDDDPSGRHVMSRLCAAAELTDEFRGRRGLITRSASPDVTEERTHESSRGRFAAMSGWSRARSCWPRRRR